MGPELRRLDLLDTSTAQPEGVECSIETLLRLLQREPAGASTTATLLDCVERFSGEYNAANVRTFIDYIEAYRQAKKLDETQAFAELPFLLRGVAHIWWQSKQPELHSWRQALAQLRQHFAQEHSADIVYARLFDSRYDERKQTLSEYLLEKWLLIAQLPHPQPALDCVRLDMLYAVLPQEMRRKVKRADLQSLQQLLEQIQTIQASTAKPGDVDTTTTTTTTSGAHVEQKVMVGQQLAALHTNGDRNGPTSAIVRCPPPLTPPSSDKYEPVIKVRRTADLMPQQLQEAAASHAAAAAVGHLASSHGDAQSLYGIDSELMHQINSIIDSCPTDEPTGQGEHNNTGVGQAVRPPTVPSRTVAVDPSQISVTMELEQNSVIVEYLPCNPPTNGGRDASEQQHSSTAIVRAPSKERSADQENCLRRKRVMRCKFCRSLRHTSSECYKRRRRSNSAAQSPALSGLPVLGTASPTNAHPIRPMVHPMAVSTIVQNPTYAGSAAAAAAASLSSSSSASLSALPGSGNDMPTPLESKEDCLDSQLVVPVKLSKACEANTPPLALPLLSTSPVQASCATPPNISVFQSQPPLPPVPPLIPPPPPPPPLTNSTLTAASPPKITPTETVPVVAVAAAAAMMTTKLILPGAIPPVSAAMARSMTARMKTSNPAAKCHQCGTIGYYRSICPNCSPIYFYKPPHNCNR